MSNERREELASLVLSLRQEAQASPERRARLEQWATRIAAELGRTHPTEAP
jgi:hypothetical protein